MTLLVDTSVWSLLLRRDTPQDSPELAALIGALKGRDLVATTGIIVQELLQGAVSTPARARIVERFQSLEYVPARREDHVAAAEVRNSCRAAGVQLGTVDALIAQLCIGHGLTLLTADRDFHHAARHVALDVWRPPQSGG